MKRKRFINLAMAEGMDRNESNFSAKLVLNNCKSYEIAYEEFYHHIKGRYECYMSGHEKRVAKKNKKFLQ